MTDTQKELDLSYRGISDLSPMLPDLQKYRNITRVAENHPAQPIGKPAQRIAFEPDFLERFDPS
jgi:hypothetical protein